MILLQHYNILCFAFNCRLKVLFGLNELIYLMNGDVVNLVVTIELLV